MDDVLEVLSKHNDIIAKRLLIGNNLLWYSKHYECMKAKHAEFFKLYGEDDLRTKNKAFEVYNAHYWLISTIERYISLCKSSECENELALTLANNHTLEKLNKEKQYYLNPDPKK